MSFENEKEFIDYLNQQIAVNSLDVIIGTRFLEQIPMFKTSAKLIQDGIDETSEHVDFLINIRNILTGK